MEKGSAEVSTGTVIPVSAVPPLLLGEVALAGESTRFFLPQVPCIKTRQQ